MFSDPSLLLTLAALAAGLIYFTHLVRGLQAAARRQPVAKDVVQSCWRFTFELFAADGTRLIPREVVRSVQRCHGSEGWLDVTLYEVLSHQDDFMRLRHWVQQWADVGTASKGAPTATARLCFLDESGRVVERWTYRDVRTRHQMALPELNYANAELGTVGLRLFYQALEVTKV